MLTQSRLLINRFKSIWAWREHKAWSYIESVLVTALVLLVCYGLNRDNPLYLHEYFPWPWIATLVVVLQYGLGPGLLSACLIAGITLMVQIPITDVQGYLLSGFTLLLVCALFSSSWLRRTIKAEELLAYTNERLDSLSSSYYMLRLSYDYLEQNVITKPYTLRMAMEELQQMGVASKGVVTAELGYQFLQVLSQYCSIHCMGMYVYDKKTLSVNPMAEIGVAGQLDLNDPLIHQAMQMQEISYTAINHMEDANACKYLVCAPMLARDGQCLGFVAIKDMSFWTLNNETLTTLSVLMTYFVEEITSIQHMPELFEQFPLCPSDFAKQLHTLLFLHQKLYIDSALCAVIIPKQYRPYNVVSHLQRQRRSPDSIWAIETPEEDIVLTLIPFTNATGIHGFFARIEQYLKTQLGLSHVDEHIQMRSMQLYRATPNHFLKDFMHYIGQNR